MVFGVSTLRRGGFGSEPPLPRLGAGLARPTAQGLTHSPHGQLLSTCMHRVSSTRACDQKRAMNALLWPVLGKSPLRPIVSHSVRTRLNSKSMRWILLSVSIVRVCCLPFIILGITAIHISVKGKGI